VRRVGLLAALLLLLGLTTATAASFDVQAEDITSFTTSTSISVPPPPQPLNRIDFYLRATSSTLPGVLDANPEGSDPVRSKRLDPLDQSFIDEADPNRYHVWQSEPMATPLTIVSARVAVYINGGEGWIVAGLFDCPVDAPLVSNVASGCVLLKQGAVDSVGTGEQSIPLGLDAPHAIPAGNRLRLKVANGNGPSGASFNVQWGYKSNRPSRVEVYTP
jgi:hypothetical protein